jgi:coenzyme F420-dependent glucose-6-phosphate dehydrogenase
MGFKRGGREVNWDLRRPGDFDAVSRFVKGEDIRKSVLVSAQSLACGICRVGFAEIHLHQVGRRQLSFIEAFGEHVLPSLKDVR